MHRARLSADAVAIGAGLGRTLAHAALRQEPTAAARAVAAELLAELRDVPEVTVEVPPAQLDELRASLADLARQAGHPGLIEVQPQAALRAGEVRLRWRDGWAERLLALIEARAAAALAALDGEPTREA